MSNYFLIGCCTGGTAPGAVSGAVAGEFAGSVSDLSTRVSCTALAVDEPFFATTLIISDKTIKVIANTQVPFSKKSPVFCTPINCDWLEKLEVKPPPLGF